MCVDKLQDKPKPLLEQIHQAKSLREVIKEACQILDEIQEDEDQTNDCFNPNCPICFKPLSSIEEVAEESGEVEWTPNQMTITVEEKPLGTSWMVAKDDTPKKAGTKNSKDSDNQKTVNNKEANKAKKSTKKPVAKDGTAKE